uniref:NADH-ubiquinone oxidoreductase chain 3 n=1 Tax=Clathrina clathrus TaxID=1031547 RepID=L0HSM2_CLACL|nr:NADH dehydrogenase subunit 3 [Clathrina clathrus]AGB07375.1 NADH dehydrogenase subunit 3 [Clathrina clathrus]
MKILTQLTLISVILSLIFFACTYILSPKYKLTLRDTYSTYECGFASRRKSRLPFKLQFFLVGILFLIFDVEITALIPYGVMYMDSQYYSQLVLILFIGILVLGVLYEFVLGGLLLNRSVKSEYLYIYDGEYVVFLPYFLFCILCSMIYDNLKYVVLVGVIAYLVWRGK